MEDEHTVDPLKPTHGCKVALNPLKTSHEEHVALDPLKVVHRVEVARDPLGLIHGDEVVLDTLKPTHADKVPFGRLAVIRPWSFCSLVQSVATMRRKLPLPSLRVMRILQQNPPNTQNAVSTLAEITPALAEGEDVVAVDIES